MQKQKLYSYLAPLTKINLKCIKDLNARIKTVKLLEGNTEKNLLDIGFGNYIWHMTPKAQETNAKINT